MYWNEDEDGNGDEYKDDGRVGILDDYGIGTGEERGWGTTTETLGGRGGGMDEGAIVGAFGNEEMI